MQLSYFCLTLSVSCENLNKFPYPIIDVPVAYTFVYTLYICKNGIYTRSLNADIFSPIMSRRLRKYFLR